MVGRIKPQARHQRIEDGRNAPWKKIGSGAVGSEADRLLLVRERALPRGTAQGTAQTRSDRETVIRSPRVEYAGMRDSKRPRDHRRTELRLAHALQERAVPE